MSEKLLNWRRLSTAFTNTESARARRRPSNYSIWGVEIDTPIVIMPPKKRPHNSCLKAMVFSYNKKNIYLYKVLRFNLSSNIHRKNSPPK